MRRSLMLGAAAILGVTLWAAPAAFAATKPPGLLTPGDLPGGFQLAAAPTPFTQGTALTVDAQACTETLAPVVSPVSGVQETFTRVGAPTNSIALLENVLVYPNAKAAKATFTRDLANHAARLKCGTVAYIPKGATTPGGTTPYQGAKFPKIGNGAYLESTGTPGTSQTNASVTFVSGPYVVRLARFGGTDPLTTADFEKIAPRALTRLRKPAKPAATTTTK